MQIIGACVVEWWSFLRLKGFLLGPMRSQSRWSESSFSAKRYQERIISGGGQSSLHSRQPSIDPFKLQLLLPWAPKPPPWLLVPDDNFDDFDDDQNDFDDNQNDFDIDTSQKPLHDYWYLIRILMILMMTRMILTMTRIMLMITRMISTMTRLRHVRVPYCTSDTWAGRRNPSEATNGYAFHGKNVFRLLSFLFSPTSPCSFIFFLFT